MIGKGGFAIEELKNELQKMTDKKLLIDVKEVKRRHKMIVSCRKYRTAVREPYLFQKSYEVLHAENDEMRSTGN